MALHDGDCVISGMPRYSRREVLEALADLVGIDHLVADLAIVAEARGYDLTAMELTKTFYTANQESYRQTGE